MEISDKNPLIFTFDLLRYLPNDKIDFIAIIKKAVKINAGFTCVPEILLPMWIYHFELLQTGVFDYKQVEIWMQCFLLNDSEKYNILNDWVTDQKFYNSIRFTWITANIVR